MKNEMSSVKELTFDEVQSVAGGCNSWGCYSSNHTISGGNGGNGSFGGTGGNGGDVNGIGSNVGNSLFGFLGSIFGASHHARCNRNC